MLEFPTAHAISSKLKVDTRRVFTHITALQNLFLLRSWSPALGTKTMYLPFDSRLFQTFLAHQLQNSNRFLGGKDVEIKFDLSRARSFVDLIFNDQLYLYCDEAYPSKRTQMSIRAIEKRFPNKKIMVCAATDGDSTKLSKQTTLLGWAELATR